MRSLWLLILLAVPVVTLAHHETGPATSTLTVSETGIVPHAPDTAFVMFGLETASKSLADAQKRNSMVMSKVMDRLRDLQIEGASPDVLFYRVAALSTPIEPSYGCLTCIPGSHRLCGK